MKKNILALISISLSSLLFFLAFPNLIYRFGFWIFGWFFALPLFYAIENKSFLKRLGLGILFGVVSNCLLLDWLFSLNIYAAFLFALALSIQPVLFSLFFSSSIAKKKIGIIYIPSLWVSCEYIRSIILGGFAWNLSYSQGFNPHFIQIADITGSWGVSFSLIFVNFCIYRIIKNKKDVICYISIAILFLVLSGYGYMSLNHVQTREKSLKVSIIQGNIDQNKKWNGAFADEIMNKYIMLTREASKTDPDLICWPETSLPGDYYNDKYTKSKITRLARDIDIPILLGAPILKNDTFFNSVILIGRDGALRGSYEKIHLIPFSEYLPLESHLSFLREKFNFKIFNFEAGEEYRIFTLKGKIPTDKDKLWNFSTTICSEDFYQRTVRKLIDSGSSFMVNLTNDALLGERGATFLHAQASIMRAVENRVPVVRCTNSGWSCFINKLGRIVNFVEKDGKVVFSESFATSYIYPSVKKTFYTKKGDYFPICSIIFCLVSLLSAKLKKFH